MVTLLRCLSQLYLRSEHLSPTCFSKKTTTAQEVSVDAKYNTNSVWKVEYVNQPYNIEMEGEPVLANRPVLLRHAATNQLLAADSVQLIVNDFGRECEVFCKRVITDKSMSLNMFCLVLQNRLEEQEMTAEQN